MVGIQKNYWLNNHKPFVLQLCFTEVFPRWFLTCTWSSQVKNLCLNKVLWCRFFDMLHSALVCQPVVHVNVSVFFLNNVDMHIMSLNDIPLLRIHFHISVLSWTFSLYHLLFLVLFDLKFKEMLFFIEIHLAKGCITFSNWNLSVMCWILFTLPSSLLSK